MTKQVNFTLPVFEEVVNKVPCKVDPAKWTDDQAQAMLAGAYLQGVRIILQRATSGTDSPEKARKAIEDKAKELTSGAYEFGQGGGGGARRDAATQGWISYLTLMGHKEGGAAVNGKTLGRAQETLCQRDVLKAHPELSGKGEAMETKRIAAVTAALPAWVKAKEEEPLLAGMIGLAAGKDAVKEG